MRRELEKFKFGLELEISGLRNEAANLALSTIRGWKCRDTNLVQSPMISNKLWSIGHDASIEHRGGTKAGAYNIHARAGILADHIKAMNLRDYDFWIEGPDGKPLVGKPSRNGKRHPVGPGDLIDGVCEIRTPPMQLHQFPDVVDACSRLCDVGAAVNSSCGGHIHVDVTELNVEDLRRLFRIVYQNEDILVKALGVIDRRLSSFARKIGTIGNPNIIQLMTKPLADKQEVIKGFLHYHGLNFSAIREHGTVEFRYFNGTIDSEELMNNVLLAVGLVARAKRRVWRAGWHREGFDATCERTVMGQLLTRLDLQHEEFPGLWKYLMRLLKGTKPVPEKFKVAGIKELRNLYTPLIQARMQERAELQGLLKSVQAEWFSDLDKIQGCTCVECKLARHLMQKHGIQDKERAFEMFKAGLLAAK